MGNAALEDLRVAIDLAPYTGRWVAIVRKQITGVGLTEQQARLASKYHRPKEEPVVVFVPEEIVNKG